jgi:hypothetical protein
VTIAHGLAAETVTIAHGRAAETVTIAHGLAAETVEIAQGLAETVNEEARVAMQALLAAIPGGRRESREAIESLAREDTAVLRTKKILTFPFVPTHRMSAVRRAVRTRVENDRVPPRQIQRIVTGRGADPVRREK